MARDTYDTEGVDSLQDNRQPDDTFVFTFIVRNRGINDDYPTHVLFVASPDLGDAIAQVEDEQLEILHAFDGAQEDLIPHE